MSKKYILDGKEPVFCDDLFVWAAWLETEKTRVALTKEGDTEVSTIFLGIEYSFSEGPPLLFETMIFGGEHNGFLKRYSTWEEAEEGHQKICNQVFLNKKSGGEI